MLTKTDAAWLNVLFWPLVAALGAYVGWFEVPVIAALTLVNALVVSRRA